MKRAVGGGCSFAGDDDDINNNNVCGNVDYSYAKRASSVSGSGATREVKKKVLWERLLRNARKRGVAAGWELTGTETVRERETACTSDRSSERKRRTSQIAYTKSTITNTHIHIYNTVGHMPSADVLSLAPPPCSKPPSGGEPMATAPSAG